jgi:hypothetical protein
MAFEILPVDKYNDLLANTYGKTPAEVQTFKTLLAADKLPGSGIIWGTVDYPTITLKEGTLMQVLPALVENAGEIYYSKISFSAYSIGNKVGATSLAGSILDAYAIRVMKERYGLGGLINMSASQWSNLSLKGHVLER